MRVLIFLATCVFSVLVMLEIDGAAVGFWLGAGWMLALVCVDKPLLDGRDSQKPSVGEPVGNRIAGPTTPKSLRPKHGDPHRQSTSRRIKNPAKGSGSLTKKG